MKLQKLKLANFNTEHGSSVSLKGKSSAEVSSSVSSATGWEVFSCSTSLKELEADIPSNPDASLNLVELSDGKNKIYFTYSK